MTQLTQAEQAEARQIMMNLPGMAFEVQPDAHSQDVGGLLHALRQASANLAGLHRTIDEQAKYISTTRRDIEGVQRLLGVRR